MRRAANPHIAEMSGPASLPRKSGELVFHDPWERRVFAMAVALCERGLYTWDEFRERLIAAIAAGEQRARQDPTYRTPSYYESWLAALEQVLADKGVVLSASPMPHRTTPAS
ncbi:MAG: nitrile hydratase accessory protein [Thermodesulfobacteriota bacterium]|jgi:nitrile hydratase accessory protein